MYRKIFHSKYFFSFIAIIFLVIFLKLGFWQLERLKLKNNLKNVIKESLLADVKDISFLSYEELEYLPLYSRVKIRARVVGDNIFLYGARYGFRAAKEGSYLCNVIQNKKGINFLINRGWVDKNIQLTNFSSRAQYFYAIVMPYEKNTMFIPSNSDKIWFTLSQEDSKSLLNVHINSYYLLATDSFSRKIQPLDVNKIIFLKNNHLEYAITWFLFAIVTIVLYTYNVWFRKS